MTLVNCESMPEDGATANYGGSWARLIRFLDQDVWTPAGTAKLIRVSEGQAAVILKAHPEKLTFVSPMEVFVTSDRI